MLQALFGVAERSLISVPGVDAQLRESIAQHMAFVHLSVAEESKRYVYLCLVKMCLWILPAAGLL